ncbi:MAG: hypothetical protein JW797_03020 [Bradymonadales bacterium]|nr:hypothetical protein [Bradymonadales bacterium]
MGEQPTPPYRVETRIPQMVPNEELMEHLVNGAGNTGLDQQHLATIVS